MAIITSYPDDSGTTDSDKFLTVDSGGATKLTPASNVESYVLAQNNIPASALATNAITLGYAQITAAVSNGTTTPTQATGLSAAVTIPAGGRRIKVTFYSSYVINSPSPKVGTISLWDGTVGSGTQLQTAQILTESVSGQGMFCSLIWSGTPSAGAKTYNIGFAADSSASIQINASATAPAFILVEAI